LPLTFGDDVLIAEVVLTWKSTEREHVSQARDSSVRGS
jgi:hypothetical protein